MKPGLDYRKSVCYVDLHLYGFKGDGLDGNGCYGNGCHSNGRHGNFWLSNGYSTIRVDLERGYVSFEITVGRAFSFSIFNYYLLKYLKHLVLLWSLIFWIACY